MMSTALKHSVPLQQSIVQYAPWLRCRPSALVAAAAGRACQPANDNRSNMQTPESVLQFYENIKKASQKVVRFLITHLVVRREEVVRGRALASEQVRCGLVAHPAVEAGCACARQCCAKTVIRLTNLVVCPEPVLAHDTLLFAEIHPPVVARTTDFLLRKKVVWYTGG
eukprot:COSAG06_NODE_10188_length_1732_cov_2.812002_1_plen_168_part_00